MTKEFIEKHGEDIIIFASKSKDKAIYENEKIIITGDLNPNSIIERDETLNSLIAECIDFKIEFKRNKSVKKSFLYKIKKLITK